MSKLITYAYQNKAQIYDKYRWRYSNTAINKLITDIHINNDLTIADIGSGTGILSDCFKSIAKKLYLIEPNEEMRKIAEKRFSNSKSINSIDGTSSNTQINSNEIDLIIAGHAVNWFDFESTLLEFQRILKEDGWIAFVKNKLISSDIEEYIGELHNEEYGFKKISSSINTKSEYEYLAGNSVHEIKDRFPTQQTFEQFLGSMVSASFFPSYGDEKYNDFHQKAEEIFRKGSKNEVINNIVETTVIYGKIRK